jgi:hypothetical protein
MWSWLSNRAPGYQKIADRLRLNYIEKDEKKSLLTLHKGYKLFKIGSGKKIKHILKCPEGSKDQSFLFEYSYTVSTGKSTTVIQQHVYSVFPGKNVPVFFIKPQNFLDDIGKWFGMQDIDFESFPAFNKNYIVKAQNRAVLEKFMTQDVLGFLSYDKGWYIESLGNQIIIYKATKRMNEEMVEPFYQAASTLYQLLSGQKSLAGMDSVPVLKKK